MKELNQIIKLAQEILSCPICQRKYSLPEIKLIGFWLGIYIFHVGCSNNHPNTSMTVVISEKPIRISQNKQTKTSQKNINARNINSQEINKLTDVLTDFDGDFEKLWKK